MEREYTQTKIRFRGGHGTGALALCCSLLSLGLLSALHFFCYYFIPVPSNQNGANLHYCVALEWQSCRDLLLASYGLAGVSLSAGLATSARRTWPGAVSIALALGILAMEVALHTHPAPPMYTS